MNNKITPEVKAMAKRAAEWMASSEGVAAIEHCVSAANEMREQMERNQSYRLPPLVITI